MNRRPTSPDNALGVLLSDHAERINKLERGYHRDAGGSFGLPFTIGSWKFEEIAGSIRITDMGTNSPVGISVIGTGQTVVGSGVGTGDPQVPPGTLPPQGIEVPVNVASTVWTIPHSLTFEPNVTCIDSAGTEFWPNTIAHSNGQVTVTMLAAQAGSVILS